MKALLGAGRGAVFPRHPEEQQGGEELLFSDCDHCLVFGADSIHCIKRPPPTKKLMIHSHLLTTTFLPVHQQQSNLDLGGGGGREEI